jgi:hypothetical protein
VNVVSDAAPRRAPRRARPVDPAAFTEIIDAALAAFTADVSYAVSMARAAVVITRKRAVWQARRELRAAEAAAHVACASTAAFECHATAACGTGDCKFATGPLAQLTTAAPAGGHIRPQPSLNPTYSLEAAVTALAQDRSAASR